MKRREPDQDLISRVERITGHTLKAAAHLDSSTIGKVIRTILGAQRVFVMGAGRSGLVARAFAMRLMHLGLNVYVIGETTTPAVRKNDVVVAISGSGETVSIVNLGKTAKELGAKLLVVTSSPDSSLGKIADLKLVIPGRTQTIIGDYMERHMRGDYASLAPLGTLFEITSLIILDVLVSKMMDVLGKSEKDLRERHATLE